MRTTLTLDDDLLEAARALARARKAPLGTVVSELLRKGLAAELQPKSRKGFPVFPVSPNSPLLTLEKVQNAEAAEP